MNSDYPRRLLRSPERPLILGHRGARAHAPDNTLEAFERALADGADGVELDVQLLACGTPVVTHDPLLPAQEASRATVAEERAGGSARADVASADGRAGGSARADVASAEGRAGGSARADVASADGRIALSHLDFNQLRKRNPTIASLQEVLDWASARDCLLNIELKNDGFAPRALARQVLALKRGLDRHRVIFSSFDPRLLFDLKRLAPAFERAQLLHADQWALPLVLHAPVRTTKAIFGGARTLHPQLDSWTNHELRRLAQRGYAINLWTVNEVADARAHQWVNALISDDPKRLLNGIAIS